MLSNAQSVDQFNAAITAANSSIAGTAFQIQAMTGGLIPANSAVLFLGGSFNKLSPAMFNAAKAAQQQGVSIDSIVSRIKTVGPEVDAATSALVRLGTAPGRTAEDIANINTQLSNLALSSDLGAQQAFALADAFLAGRITAGELQTALQNIAASNAVIKTQLEETTQAQNLAATGGAAYNTVLQSLGITQTNVNETTNAYAEALQEELTKQKAAEEQARLMEEVKKVLAELGPQVAAGLLSEADAALILAQRFGFAEQAARGLIQAKRELASVGDVLLAGQNANTRDNGTGRLGGTGRTGTGSSTNRGSDAQRVDAILEQAAANEALRESERNLAIAQGGRAAEIKLLQQDLAGLQQGTVEYNNTLAKLTQLQEQESKASARGGGAKLSAQDKLNNQLAANQDKYYDKIENAEISHQQKLLDIYEDFAKKQLAAQRAGEVSKRRSRADFYSDLIDQENVDQAKFSAEYEQAFEESQKMAQAGQAQLAQDYLALREKQIQEDIDFAKRRAEIAADDEMSKAEKEAKLKALDEIDKMRKDAQAAETKALLEGGDENINALNEKLAEEEERYNEQTGKIATAAEQAADARIAAWQRANQAIAAIPPAELTAFNGQVPTTTAANAAAAQAVANIPPVPVTTPTTPQATIDSSQVASVRLAELALVRDEGVISEIGALAARLEGKLTELAGILNNQTGTLASKLDTVASAVRSSRPERLVR